MKSVLIAVCFTIGLVLSSPRLAAAQSSPDIKLQVRPANAGSRAPCVAPAPAPVAVLDAPFLVFGEVQGTREVPHVVAGYLSAATKQQRKVTLALEYPASQQAAIDAFLASRGTTQDADRFAGTAFWRGERQDGRTSVDMLRMYESIRALPAGGGYESTIYRLADQHPLTLTVGTSGGTAWVCRGATPASCNATAWDINRVTPEPSTPFSLDAPSAQFDGVFFVGATTASPPAATRADPN